MDSLKRYRDYSLIEGVILTDSGEIDDIYNTIIDGYTDNENEIVHWTYTYNHLLTYDGKPLSMENYIFDHMDYTKLPTDDKWSSQALTEEDFNYYFDTVIPLGDVLYAALSIDKNRSDNKIYLSGDVYLNYYLADDPTVKIYFDECFSEIEIDKSTGYITQTHTINKYKLFPKDEEPYIVKEDYIYNPSYFNGNFSIKIPDELKINK